MMRAQKSFRKLTLLAWCLVGLAAAATAARAEILLERAVVLTGEWAPFTSERMDDKGLLSGLVTEILRGMGREPEYHFLPFSEALKRTKEGDAIGTFPWFKTTRREESFVYSAEILSVDYVIFYNRDIDSGVTEATEFDDLTCLKTAVVEEYAYGKFDTVLNHGKRACRDNIIEVKSEFLAFDKLAKGEIEYLAASKAVGQSLIRRTFSIENQRKFDIRDQPGLSWPIGVHFLFLKGADADDLKELFDLSLAAFKDSGRVDEVERQLEWLDKVVVALTNPDGGPVVGQRKPGGTSLLAVPGGNRAVVLEWSERFVGKSAGSNREPEMTHVQLINGPLRGERLWVRDKFISLAGD